MSVKAMISSFFHVLVLSQTNVLWQPSLLNLYRKKGQDKRSHFHHEDLIGFSGLIN